MDQGIERDTGQDTRAPAYRRVMYIPEEWANRGLNDPAESGGRAFGAGVTLGALSSWWTPWRALLMGLGRQGNEKGRAVPFPALKAQMIPGRDGCWHAPMHTKFALHN